MTPKATLSALAFTSLLTFSFASAPELMAANPSFSVTSRLTPQEGAALFRFHFEATDLFGKEKRQSVKLTYWTPTPAEVYQAETCLASDTAAINGAIDQSTIQIGLGPQDIVLTTDIRQYAGIMQDSKRLLLVYGLSFSDAPSSPLFTINSLLANEALHNRTGHLSDGNSAFRAAYDLDAHRVIFLNYDHLVERKQPQALLHNSG